MGERTTYTHGQPCYVDLMTPDFEASCRLYERLLGATFDESDIPEGRYGHLRRDGHIVSGVGHSPAAEVPTAWNTYVAVDDVEAATEAAVKLGATPTMPVMDVGDNGRMAGVADPAGAPLFLWQAKEAAGCELVNDEGAWSWSELWTTDADAAQSFYANLFGWSFDVMPADGGDESPPYFTIDLGGRMLGGLTTITARQAGMTPHWSVYFAVPDADAAAALIAEAGGRVHFGPTDIPVGRMWTASDPQGAIVSCICTSGPMDP